jgi:hypothetical protein
MLASAIGAGFALASRADVEALVASMPLNAGQWPSYQPIIGDAPNRELYWGFYDDGNGDPYGWAFAFDSDTDWSFFDDIAPGNVIQNDRTDSADMNIWAYQRQLDLPIPATAALLGIAALGLGASRRRKPA